jgi:hypothetical protein
MDIGRLAAGRAGDIPVSLELGARQKRIVDRPVIVPLIISGECRQKQLNDFCGMESLLKVDQPAIAVVLKKNSRQAVQPGTIIVVRTFLQQPFIEGQFRIKFAGGAVNGASPIQCFQGCL